MLSISPQKLYSFSRYLNFCLDFFDYVAKQLDQKDKDNFNIYDVTAWLTIVMHILPNILRSKDNQTMKFDQLIDYNMTIIFIEKCPNQAVFST